MRAIRWTAGTLAVLTFAMIVLGAVVRATNSGLSCPDWPTCYGQWVPLPSHIEEVPNIGYTYGQVMLEWVHRLVAGFLLGPLVLAVAILAWQRRWIQPGLAAAGGVLLILVVIQGLLGGVTVLDRNSPWSVALHLGNALLVLSTTLLIWVRSLETAPAGAARSSLPVGGLAALAWATALLAMTSAAVTSKSGASFACTGWPLCGEGAAFGSADPLVTIHMTHRLLAAAVALSLAALFWAVRRDPAARRADRALSIAALGLVTVEVALGALVVLHGIPLAPAVVHQATGVATFALVTVLLWRCVPFLRDDAVVAEAGGVDGLAVRGARGAV